MICSVQIARPQQDPDGIVKLDNMSHINLSHDERLCLSAPPEPCSILSKQRLKVQSALCEP